MIVKLTDRCLLPNVMGDETFNPCNEIIKKEIIIIKQLILHTTKVYIYFTLNAHVHFRKKVNEFIGRRCLKNTPFQQADVRQADVNHYRTPPKKVSIVFL